MAKRKRGNREYRLSMWDRISIEIRGYSPWVHALLCVVFLGLGFWLVWWLDLANFEFLSAPNTGTLPDLFKPVMIIPRLLIWIVVILPCWAAAFRLGSCAIKSFRDTP